MAYKHVLANRAANLGGVDFNSLFVAESASLINILLKGDVQFLDLIYLSTDLPERING
jgi:hypothetical protein